MSQVKQDTELKVFITTGDSSCGECGEQLGRHAWITLVEGKGALWHAPTWITWPFSHPAMPR